MNPNTSVSEEDESYAKRASRRGLVKLMRGDIIRFNSRSQLNTKIFFIDYIDDRMVRLIPDMRGKVASAGVVDDAASAHIIMNLDEQGRFDPDAQVERIELLYRNDEPGYARQRGLVPGTWIEIEYITETDDVKIIVYGEIKTLEHGTDCIGVSIYNSNSVGATETALNLDEEAAQTTFVFIDFEFKGLSNEIGIKEIRRCAMPKSLRNLSRGTGSDVKKKVGVSSDNAQEDEVVAAEEEND